MAVVYPDSTICLYAGVDIDMNSKVSLVFQNIVNQRAYFQSKLNGQYAVISPATVVKKTGWIKVSAPMTTVKQCNYISFVNPSFDNVVYYGAITNYDYINNDTTGIKYVLDEWQTRMFEVDYEPCRIARQSLNESDYDTSLINPYSGTIYAFQTPEALPVYRQLEKTDYEIQMFMDQTNAKDGKFLVTSNTVGKAGQVDGYPISYTAWLAGKGNSAVITMAHFDVTAFPLFDIIKWGALIQSIEAMGGHYMKSSDSVIPLDADNKQIYNPQSTTPTYALVPWTNMPRAHDIIEIPYPYTGTYDSQNDVNLLDKVLEFMTAWQAIGQILAMYNVPTFMFLSSFMRTDWGTPVYPVIGNDNTFGMPTAFERTEMEEGVYNPDSKKLLTFPFAYLRVESTDGTAREYKYEDFVDVRNSGATHMTFRYCMDISGIPVFYLAPIGYKQSINIDPQNAYEISVQKAMNTNLDERIEVTQFPQLPYSIDGYLAHLSQEYMGVIQNNTAQAQIERNHQMKISEYNIMHQGVEMAGDAVADTVGGIADVGSKALTGAQIGSMFGPTGAAAGAAIGAGAGLVTSIGRGLSHGLGNTAELESLRAQQDRTKAEVEMVGEAYRFLSNPSKENPRFSDTKPAFANDYYRAGTSNGALQCLKGTPYQDIKITHVQLRDEILRKYDEYFKLYGYNVAGMIDIPYVINYIQGQNNPNKVPHWETVNGKECTYIRTVDCHVKHAMYTVSEAIEAMFNSGVRLIKGESLLPSNS